MSTAAQTTEIMYSISQVQALTGVSKSTIRFWEREFKDFLMPQRTQGNQRRYNEDSVEVIAEIRKLVEVEGYTLEGAKRKLREGYASSGESRFTDQINLDQLASTVSDYILRRMFDQLSAG